MFGIEVVVGGRVWNVGEGWKLNGGLDVKECGRWGRGEVVEMSGGGVVVRLKGD